MSSCPLTKEFEEVRSQFERWARESGLLKPGASFVTTFCVTGVPLVQQLPENTSVVSGKDKVLDMKLNDFFSRERVGETSGAILYKLKGLQGLKPLSLHGSDKPMETVRDLVSAGRFGVGSIRSYGSATVKRIDEMLKAAGIEWKN